MIFLIADKDADLPFYEVGDFPFSPVGGIEENRALAVNAIRRHFDVE